MKRLHSGLPRVALFLPSLGGGGAERVMLNLARGFAEQGMGVDLVLASAEGPYLDQVPSGINVVDLGAGRVIKSLVPRIRYLRKARPVAMLSAIEHACVVSLWAARLARTNTRMVVTVHTTLSRYLDRSQWRSRLLFTIIRRFYPWADAVVVVSNAVRDDFLEATAMAPDNVRVIYNPVVTPELFEYAKAPVNHEWFAPGEPPVILGVGRLTQQKDFQSLLRAFALVRQQAPVRLVILGEGDERTELEKLAAELGISGDVDLHGFVDNPYAYMANAALFVLSSEIEGLPTVLIEALAVGVPVLSTDCPSGAREILDNGCWGKLVPVGDVCAMADGILESLRRERQTVSSEYAWRRFELQRVSREYAQLLVGDIDDQNVSGE